MRLMFMWDEVSNMIIFQYIDERSWESLGWQ